VQAHRIFRSFTCYHGVMRHPVDSARPVDAAIPRTEAREQTLEPGGWEGDDDHVIFWMLSLTPTQRVEVAQEFIDGVMMLRNGLRS